MRSEWWSISLLLIFVSSSFALLPGVKNSLKAKLKKPFKNDGIHGPRSNKTYLSESNKDSIWRYLDEIREKMKVSITKDPASDCVSEVSSIFFHLACSIHSDETLCKDPKSELAPYLLDALPRPPPGVLRKAPFFFLGDFEECQYLSVNHSVSYNTIRMKAGIANNTFPLVIGICLPSSCSVDFLSTVTSSILDVVRKTEWLRKGTGGGAGAELELEDVYRHGDKEHELYWQSIKPSLVLFFTLLAALLGGGTLLDYIIRQDILGEKQGKKRGRYRNTRYTESDYEESSSPSDHRGAIFSAPSIALTYKSLPAIRRTFTTRTLLIDIALRPSYSIPNGKVAPAVSWHTRESVEKEETQIEPKRLCSFSLRLSAEHLLRNSAREIPILNGIKVLSAFWVIVGHSCLFSLPLIDTVRPLMTSLSSSRLAPLILNSSLAVDSFLFISGTVLAFTVRKRNLFRHSHLPSSIPRQLLRFFFFLLHRAWRLWPSLLLTCFFVHFIYNHLGDGPLWNANGMFGTTCGARDVVPHLLFLSNFFPSLCLPWLWHVAVDFQLYLVSPLLLFLFSRWHRPAYALTIILLVAAILYRITIYSIYSLPANMFIDLLTGGEMSKGETAFRLLYGSPLARSPPFIIGLLTGWSVSLRSSRTLSIPLSLAIKSLIAVLMIYAVYAPYSMQEPYSYIHAVSHRLLWALSLSLLVWMAETGHAPISNWLLGSPRWLPLSRLSLGVYLSHEPILLYLLHTQRVAASPTSPAHFLLLSITVGILSLAAALLLAICIEIPILTLERKLLKRTEKKFNRKQTAPGLSADLQVLLPPLASVSYVDKTAGWLKNGGNPYREIINDSDIHQVGTIRMQERASGGFQPEDDLLSSISSSFFDAQNEEAMDTPLN